MQIAVGLAGGEADDSVIAAGEAWGLTGIARSWSYYTNGMLSELNYGDLCKAAGEAHSRAKVGLKDLPATAFPAVAYAALVPKFLAKLTQTRHDAATQSVQYAPVLKQLRLMGAVITGRI
jgi:phytoene synthase